MSEPSTRDKLLRAASDVACEAGWNGATSRLIAERAGVNLALINYHFRSKDELLLASLEHTMTHLGQAPVAGSIEELQTILTQFVSTYADSPDFRLLFQATLHAPYDAAVRAAVQRHLSEFRMFIAGTLGVLGADAPTFAQAIAALLDGLFLHLLIDPKTDLVAVTTRMLELLFLAEKQTL